MFEDAEDEDLYGTGGLGALNVAPVMSSPDDAMAAWQSAQQLVSKQNQSNLALLSAARDRIRQQRVGPSQAEQLLAIASALGRPTKSGSFGETMGNLSGALLEQATAKRSAEDERQAMLEKYGMQMGNEQLRALMTAAGQAGQVYSRSAAAHKPSTPVWAPDLNQFVSRDKPVPTPNKVQVGDMMLTQYTDGNLYLRNADGSKDVYTPEGEKIATIPAGGAR